MKAFAALKVVTILAMLAGLTACPKGPYTGYQPTGEGHPSGYGASLSDRYKIDSTATAALTETLAVVSQSGSTEKLLELGFSSSDLNQMLETGTINPNAMDVFSALGFQPESAQLLVQDVRASFAE